MLKTEQAIAMPLPAPQLAAPRRRSGEWWIELLIRGAGMSTIFIIGLIFLFLLREGLPALFRVSPFNLLRHALVSHRGVLMGCCPYWWARCLSPWARWSLLFLWD